MPKVNVNAAAVEELVDVAGLRPELAQAIVKLRDQRGRIGSADELDEVPGVGPATLERLRETLSFGATAEEKAERDSARTAQAGERAAREATEKAAKAPVEAVRQGVEFGRGVARAGTEAASRAAQGGLQLAQRVGAAGEAQRETVRKAGEGTAEFSRLFMEIVSEQTKHSMQVAEALGRTIKWDELVRMQGEFVRDSVERMNQLNRRYLEIVQGVMHSAADATKGQGKKGD